MEGVTVQSVHHFKLPPCNKENAQQQQQQQQHSYKKKTSLADPRNLNVEELMVVKYPCVLHYVTCGLEWFKDK
jgi:hypothetical protein